MLLGDTEMQTIIVAITNFTRYKEGGGVLNDSEFTMYESCLGVLEAHNKLKTTAISWKNWGLNNDIKNQQNKTKQPVEASEGSDDESSDGSPVLDE